jgi:hypothetical protein
MHWRMGRCNVQNKKPPKPLRLRSPLPPILMPLRTNQKLIIYTIIYQIWSNETINSIIFKLECVSDLEKDSVEQLLPVHTYKVLKFPKIMRQWV